MPRSMLPSHTGCSSAAPVAMHHIVGVHVQHLTVREPDDDHRARVDTDDVVAQLAGQHRDLAAVGTCGRGRGRCPDSPAPITTRSACWRRTCRRRVSSVRRPDRRAAASRSGGAPTAGWRTHSQARPRRREAGAGERNSVDLGAAVAAIAGQAQRAAVLRMLAGAHDRHGNGIAVGVLDRLVVNHDAHARPTVANRPFPARLCCESVRRPACETTRDGSPDVRVALVTGAGSGIGRAVAVGLAEDGFTCRARRPPSRCVGTRRRRRSSGSRLVQPTDVRDVASVDALFAAIEARFGRLDLLFNNAGVGAPADSARRADARAMATSGRHQPHRVVPVRPASDGA